MNAMNSHSLAYARDPEHGISVPVTEIALEDSPNGVKNPPFTAYRTAGPGSDPVIGLEPFRSEWIASRGDTEPYGGRERNLLDDGKSAVRRGAASALDIGRVRHDVVEHARAEPGRRPQQIAGDQRNARAHAVERRILDRQPHQVALQFEPDDAALRDPRGEA